MSTKAPTNEIEKQLETLIKTVTTLVQKVDNQNNKIDQLLADMALRDAAQEANKKKLTFFNSNLKKPTTTWPKSKRGRKFKSIGAK